MDIDIFGRNSAIRNGLKSALMAAAAAQRIPDYVARNQPPSSPRRPRKLRERGGKRGLTLLGNS